MLLSLQRYFLLKGTIKNTGMSLRRKPQSVESEAIAGQARNDKLYKFNNTKTLINNHLTFLL